MNRDHSAETVPRWATAADGEAADTSPVELSALGEHLQSCSGSRGRLPGLRRVAEAVHGFALTRLITTLVVSTVFIAFVSLLL